MHMYIYIHVCIYIYIYIHRRCVYMCKDICARVYAWARMCTACSECYMHFGTGVLGTSAREGVYVTQVCFYTNVHICDILTAGCARVCVCVYMRVYGCVCVWMRVCVYVIA